MKSYYTDLNYMVSGPDLDNHIRVTPANRISVWLSQSDLEMMLARFEAACSSKSERVGHGPSDAGSSPATQHHRIGFLEGAIEGITLYATWRNGEQLVGCMERPLKTVLQPYRDELAKLTALPPPAPPSEAVSPDVRCTPPAAVIDPLSPHHNDPPGEPRGGLSGERGGGVPPLIQDILDRHFP